MNKFYELYNKNIHSQNGEDGILSELLRRIYSGEEELSYKSQSNIPKNLWVCEFGAWDGIFLSNTFQFVKTGVYSAIYIEGDDEHFKALLETQKEYPNIIAIKEYVGYDKTKENSLDNILKKTPIPIDFDILSIDIDGYDYQVWESLEIYRPKIVVIEINSGIEPDVLDYIHKPGVYVGTSFLPMYLLAIKKGYKFVLHTGNMIFIREDLYDKVNMKSATLFENFRRFN